MKKKILALILCAMMATTAVVGGTLAYFTDTDKDVNVMTTGNIKIVQNETERDGSEYVDEQPLLPAVYLKDTDTDGIPDTPYTPKEAWEGPEGNATGSYTGPDGNNMAMYDNNINNEIDKVVSVTNRGNVDAYIRTIILIEDTNSVSDEVHILYNSGLTKETIDNVDIGDGNTYEAWIFTYETALKKGETSAPSLQQVWLDPNATSDWYKDLQDDKLTIIAFSQAAQTTGFANATEALDTAFADVTAQNIKTWVNEYNIKTSGVNNKVDGFLDENVNPTPAVPSAPGANQAESMPVNP